MAVPNRVVHRTVRTAVLSSGRGGRLQSCVVGAVFGLERQAVDQQQLSQRLLGADGHALHSHGHSHRDRHGGPLRRLSHVGLILRRCVQVDRRGAAVQHHLPQSAVLVALFCIGWSAWDRVCVFFNKRPFPFSFDIISLSVPLLVGLGSFYHA